MSGENNNVISLTQHNTADVINTLCNALLAPAHSNTSLRTPRQGIARNLNKKNNNELLFRNYFWLRLHLDICTGDFSNFLDLAPSLPYQTATL